MENEKTGTTPVTTPPLSEMEELTQTLKRVQADFENYRKRSQNEFNSHYVRGKAAAFKEILAFLDTLDAAILQITDTHMKDLEKLRTHLMQILIQNGVRPLSTVGKDFDPFTSECVMQGNDPGKRDDVVLEEYQRGYTFHGDVLRPAKVKVNKRSENNDIKEKTKGENNHE